MKSQENLCGPGISVHRSGGVSPNRRIPPVSARGLKFETVEVITEWANVSLLPPVPATMPLREQHPPLVEAAVPVEAPVSAEMKAA